MGSVSSSFLELGLQFKERCQVTICYTPENPGLVVTT